MDVLGSTIPSDDLDRPLAEVTFVVVDLETTGGSPDTAGITEVGAVKYRAGVCEGELQTLVNPEVEIPPFVASLTGISDAMVSPAPPVSAVLPAVLEFVGRGVIVGHNVRFDLSFLDAALVAHDYPPLANPSIDTVLLARRLLADETTDHKLATVTRHVRTSRAPIHRALDDARATADLLHALLERAGAIGLLGLDDLLALCDITSRNALAKLKLAERLPRHPGVFLFRDVGGRVLHVGRAENLRAGVLAYFVDRRRRIRDLLRQTFAIDHIVCDVDGTSPLPGRR